MRRWILQVLVVVAVVGAFAVGRGFRASAEVPADKAQKPAGPRFLRAQSHYHDDVFPWLRDHCDPTRNFTVTFIPLEGGGRTLACCVTR